MNTDYYLRRVWNAMKSRCNSEGTQSYYLYGGRGIQVCKEWSTSYNRFKLWALTHGYKRGLTLDRIDNDGNYEPSNCRWVTMAKQAHNRRNTVKRYPGVRFHKRDKVWEAHVKHRGRQQHVGSFPTEEAAVCARNWYIIENNLPHKIQQLYI